MPLRDTNRIYKIFVPNEFRIYGFEFIRAENIRGANLQGFSPPSSLFPITLEISIIEYVDIFGTEIKEITVHYIDYTISLITV